MKIQTSKFGEVHVLTNCPLLDSTESIQFRTEVNQSIDGTEYRNPLLETPRQTLNFNYVEMRKAMGDLWHMLYANLRKNWGIPLYHLKQDIPNLDDEDFILMDTSINGSDLHLGYALIETLTSQQIVELKKVGRYVVTQQEERDSETDEILVPEAVVYQDGFKLDRDITATNAKIMPIRICIIDGDVDVNTGGFWARGKLSFLVHPQDGPEYAEDEPAQYKNHDFYTKPLLLNGTSLEMSLSQHQVIVDGDLGQFVQFSDHAKPRYLKPMRCVIKDKAEFIEFRKFLMRRAGRYLPFWLPLYEKHLNVVSTGMLASWFEVNNDYVIEADRKHVAIKRAGVWSAHEITNKVINSGITRLTVSPAINSQRSAIESICYLGLHRLDSDRIDFSFLGKNIVQTTIPIIEIQA